MNPGIFNILIVLFGLIFFFNDALPFGLTLGLIFSPIFFLYALKWHQGKSILVFGLFLLFLNGIHQFVNANIQYQFISSVVLMSVFVTSLTFWIIASNNKIGIHHFKKLTLLNAIGVFLAYILFFIPELKSILWYEVPFTLNYDSSIPRLKLFTLEASHYSLIIMPLFLYYFTQIIKKYNFNNTLLFLSLLIALAISFSLGVILIIAIAISGFLIIHLKQILSYKFSRKIILFSLLALALILIFLYIFYPNNPLYFRIGNLFIGDDTSGRGRTYEAFDIAWKLLNHKHHNKWIGIGLGQFKEDGRQLLIQYYHYMKVPEVVRLPNALAETLVTFGIFGLVGKIGLQIFLFFKTKVYNNVFQLLLFIAIFVYQFTGSYLFNLTEYFIWILAFTPLFKSLNNSVYFDNTISKI